MMGVQQILTSVKNQYGIDFREVGTGGGCMALEARLESGHWIVATDENLMGLRERIDYESDANADGETTALGWFVGIYPNNTEHGDDWWGGGDTPIAYAHDYDVYADALPNMVGRALSALVSN